MAVGTVEAVEVAPAEGEGERPALRAFKQALWREGRRMGIRSLTDLAKWVGADPGNLSKYLSGKVPFPAAVGRRIVKLFDHDPGWQTRWLRLAREQELLAMRAEAEGGAAGDAHAFG